MTSPNRRDYYRIPYAPTERPRLVVADQLCEVLDCSEQGVRFRPSADSLPLPGTELRGRLRFPRGVELLVAGTVVRVQEGAVSLRFHESIPFVTILREQLHLRKATRQSEDTP